MANHRKCDCGECTRCKHRAYMQTLHIVEELQHLWWRST